MKPRKEHVLQILIYWRMGLHSIYPQFQSVKYLGIYNPRLNMVYRYDASIIPVNVIGIVEKQIIGYEV